MPYERKDREHGWMNAIGLLLKNVPEDVAKNILDVVKLYGNDLYIEVQNGGHDDTAAAKQVNPCPPGYEWNNGQHCCILIGGEPEPI
jgi:hypothetical protein